MKVFSPEIIVSRATVRYLACACELLAGGVLNIWCITEEAEFSGSAVGSEQSLMSAATMQIPHRDKSLCQAALRSCTQVGVTVERARPQSVSLLPRTEIQLDGDEGVSVPQALVENIKICLPQSLKIVLQHHSVKESRGSSWRYTVPE